ITMKPSNRCFRFGRLSRRTIKSDEEVDVWSAQHSPDACPLHLANRRVTTVDDEDLSGYVARRLGGQVERQVDDLLGVGETTHRNLVQHSAIEPGVLHQAAREVR